MANKRELSNRPGRRKYSKDEDMRIWKYVNDKRADNVHLAGNNFWKQMQKEQVVPCRTWMSLRDRYLKQIRPRRLQPLKSEPAYKNNLHQRMKRKVLATDSEEDEYSCTVSTIDGISEPSCSPDRTSNNEDVGCSPNRTTGKSPSSLENDNCNESESQMFQLDSGCKSNAPNETGKGKDVSSRTESTGNVSPDASNRCLSVLVDTGVEERESRVPKQPRTMDDTRKSIESSNVVSGQRALLDFTHSEAAVIKMITLIRCKTKASLSQVVFSLFRTNANEEKAIALLNDKDTTNVWTAQEDEILQGKDVKAVERIIDERGHFAVEERLNFIEQSEIVAKNSV